MCPTCKWTAGGEPWEVAAAGAKARPVEAADAQQDFAVLLAKARFNAGQPPPPPVPLYSLAGHTIATAENIMILQAKIKAGKSAAVGAMIASTMDPAAGADCLWFASANPKKFAVVHLDTEQSSFDHYQSVSRALRRAGKPVPPSWLYSYHIKGHSIGTMRRLLSESLDRGAQETGGVHSCLLDGVGDICPDVNDAAGANALVAELEALAIKYQTLIACVLHENHGSDSGKTRGHLGSQLARKAETNLRLEKDSEGVTVMFADTSRSVHITKKQAPGFRWDDEQRCHVSVVTSVNSMMAQRANAEMQALADECFKGTGTVGLSWAEVTSAIKTHVGCAQTAAEKCLRKMTDAMIVTKKDNRYYAK